MKCLTWLLCMIYITAMNVNDLLPIFGTQAEIARQMGVTRQTVNYWSKAGIPNEHQLRLRYEVLPAVLNQSSPEKASTP